MDEIDFARQYLGEFKVKGDEIIVKYCPICHGGHSGKKNKFFLNMDKHTFICHRASCGAKGTFYELTKMYNEKAEYVTERWKSEMDRGIKRQRKVYKTQKEHDTNNNLKPFEYLKSRGISHKTAIMCNIQADNKGNIVFPYFEKGMVVLNKLRPAKEVKKGDLKAWQDGGGKPILWRLDDLDFTKPIILTEGEIDCMSVIEAGYDNVTSIPFGCENFEWIEECWDKLKNMNQLIIFGDADKVGVDMVDTIVTKLGAAKIKNINIWDRGINKEILKGQRKDANSVLTIDGKERIKELIKAAEYIPVNGLLDIADVEFLDPSRMERVKSGINVIDNILKGFVFPALTVWTGKRGNGKSTVVSQSLLNCIEQDKRCFVYSGEMMAGHFKQWFYLQAVKPNEVIDETVDGDIFQTLPKNLIKKIDEWTRGKLLIYDDNNVNTEDEIVKMMEYAYERYNCKVFLLDNLTTVKFNGRDKYLAQSEFVDRLRNFVKNKCAHVHLVVHPRKTGANDVEDNDEVGGSGDITNLAFNVIRISKVNQEMIDRETNQERRSRLEEADTIVKIMKNRYYMRDNIEGFYRFNTRNRNITSIVGGTYPEYSWRDSKVEKLSGIEDLDDIMNDNNLPY